MSKLILPIVLLLVVVACVACGATPPPQQQFRSSTPQKPVPAADIKPWPPPPFDDASLLYLEEVEGDRALAFARAHNAVSEKQLKADPGFQKLEERLNAIYSSKDKIPEPNMHNSSLRNFWTDADHQRGLWRETTLAEYRRPDPKWTTLLDIDALNKAENESFVYHGVTCLYPGEKKCLVRLSRGGTDAEIVREFDVDKKDFVKGGFVLPEAKLNVGWKDENTIYVGTNFGPGSATKASLPRISKEWKRGTPLTEAKLVFEVKETDLRGICWRSFDHDRKRDFCEREIDFEHSERFVRGEDGKSLVKIDKPDDADAGIWEDELLLHLRSDWKVDKLFARSLDPVETTTYPKDSLIITSLKAFMSGKREFQVLFTPTKQSSFAYWIGTKTRLLVNTLSDVKNQVTVFARPNPTAKWVGTPLKESLGAVDVWAFDTNRSDDTWMWIEDFTVPSSLQLWNLTTNKREPMKKKPAFFDATNLDVAQHFATSKDGTTKVPYFEIARKGRTGAGPTLINAYGGFEVSLTPGYDASVGAAWLERGGTYVQANLRGGGEYGPAWHESAMRQNRQNAYDDLAAVAQDLVRRGVTTSKSLGVLGGSNGGLLTSVMLTQRPDLWGAIVSMVPLTDMQRFHKLLTGAAWMNEYGDPDDAKDWAALAKYSPFQNVKRVGEAGTAPYPPVFYTTSTKDDRVHPAHARKMVAKLEALGHSPLYYENIEGGHGGAADIKQRAYLNALIYTFLTTRLGVGAGTK